MKSKNWHYSIVLMLIVCIGGCKDENDDGSDNFDPDKPVVISDFIPKVGGLATRLVLYGDNFGNDISKIKVIIGGQDAKVVGVKNQNLHCIVPARAYDGDIEVIITDENGEEMARTEAESHFTYEKKLLVSTFLGKYAERVDDVVIKNGPFDDSGSFRDMRWLSFDPQNPNHLYMACQTRGTRLIDFEKEYVSTFSTGIDNVSSVNWTLEGDMILSRDHANDAAIGTFLFTRASGFVSKSDISLGRGLKSTDTHPVNGEMYFTRFRAGDVQRYDFETRELKTVFQNPYGGVHFLLIIHPTGEYAYLVESERHYIMRTDYNWETKEFMIPYLVCGAAANAGYADGVGSSARLAWPLQGVFVQNPDYEGNEDEYDFYFCDRDNHAIRKLTPLGRVETFAGRGNNGTWGYNDGDLRTEARFNQPQAIVYDELRQCFYVGDNNNYLIRKIGYEE
jgi:IPT/TIG domain.